MPNMMDTSWATLAQGSGKIEGFDVDDLGDLGECGLRVAVARMFALNAVPPDVVEAVDVAERAARTLHRAIAEVAIEMLAELDAQGRNALGQVIPPEVLTEMQATAEAEQRRAAEEERMRTIADDLRERSAHRPDR